MLIPNIFSIYQCPKDLGIGAGGSSVLGASREKNADIFLEPPESMDLSASSLEARFEQVANANMNAQMQSSKLMTVLCDNPHEMAVLARLAPHINLLFQPFVSGIDLLRYLQNTFNAQRSAVQAGFIEGAQVNRVPALLVVAGSLPAWVMLDLLERIDGLRHNYGAPAMPTMLLSESTELQTIAGQLQQGVRDMISKPLREEEFVARARVLLNLNHAKSEGKGGLSSYGDVVKAQQNTAFQASDFSDTMFDTSVGSRTFSAQTGFYPSQFAEETSVSQLRHTPLTVNRSNSSSTMPANNGWLASSFYGVPSEFAASQFRPAPQPLPAQTWGIYKLDPARQSVQFKNQTVNLSRREFELAWMLFQNIGQVLPRQMLMNHMSVSRNILNSRDGATGTDGNPALSRSLDTHISRLRSVLELKSENGFVLESVYRIGYVLRMYSSGVGETVSQNVKA